MQEAVTSEGTRVYFSVPDGYTIGREFDKFDEAVEFGKSKIREIEGCPGSFTRACVDIRVQDKTGDRPVHRVEVAS